MKKIREYLSEEQIADLANLSDQEKLSMAMDYIKSVDPSARFRCSELAEFLGKDPKYPRGMFPMVEAIKKKDKNFPIEMIETNRSGGKQGFNAAKLADLKSRWSGVRPVTIPSSTSGAQVKSSGEGAELPQPPGKLSF